MILSENAIKLKQLRDYLGYSQRDLAKEFQVTSGAIAHWESGARPIPGPVTKLLAAYWESLPPDTAETLISNEAMKASQALFNLSLKKLDLNDLRVESDIKEVMRQTIDIFFKESFSRGQISGKIKIAIARQILDSLVATKGLSIKILQLASFVQMGLPQAIPVLIGSLLANAKPMSFKLVQKALECAYNQPLEEIFDSISEEPLAVTSLAQLHRAKLVTGENIVIKLRNPDIERILKKQVRQLSLVSLLKKILGSSSDEIMNEIQEQVFSELDYEREVRNQIRFQTIFESEQRIVVPTVYRDLCRPNIIVSHFEMGLSFSAFCSRANPTEKNQAAMVIAYFHSFSIFRRGLLHGDAHPGNFLFRENQVVFLDFGRIFEMSPEDVERERVLYSAILHKNKKLVINEFVERKLVSDPESFDFDQFWNLLLRQEEHHLTDKPMKLTKAHLCSKNEELLHFKDRKKLRYDRRLFRSHLVNLCLTNLFADLEAQGAWRTQALEILNPKITSPRVHT